MIVNGLLHAPAVLFVGAAVGLLGSLLLIRNSGRGPRGQTGAIPAAWLAGAFVQAVASLGHAFRGELPQAFVFSAVNATQLLALSLLWFGTRRLLGRKLPGWSAFVTPALWLAACLIPAFMASQRVRLGLYAPLAYGAALWAARDLLALYRQQRIRAALDMGAVIGLVALCLLALVVCTIIIAPPDNPQALFTGLPAVLTAVYGAALPFLMLALTREREAVGEGERRAAALQAGRAEVERLHAGLPAVVFLADVRPEGCGAGIRLLYQGGDTAAVFGWPGRDVAGIDRLQALADCEEPCLADRFRKAFETGEQHWEWRVRRQDGAWSWIRTCARRLDRPDGGAAEVFGYSLNVDRERAAEARAMVAARMASLGEMAAGIAHEIRQPLQTISLAAEVAQHALAQSNPAAADGRLRRIVAETRRASTVIEYLRRFARGADDTTPLADVPLDAAVEAALTLAGFAIRDASAKVEIAFGHPAPVVRGRAVLLEQLFANLLMNACDALATRPPGVPRRIGISAAASPDGMVRVTVTDNGGGIEAPVLARLFEPFVTTKGPDKGTGLGLAICHGLVKGMGGSIEAHNAGEGAVFTVTLPAAVAAPAVPAAALPA